MKIQAVIDYLNDIKPNAFTNDTLVMWLNECEGHIQTEVLCIDVDDVITYSYERDKNKELLVKAPHDKLYGMYLIAMTDFAYGEYSKYANTLQMYNAALEEFAKWYIRHHTSSGTTLHGYYISAYGIAQKHGFEGTEEEWLESLRGETGPQGIQGVKGDKGDPGDVSSVIKGSANGEILVDGSTVIVYDDSQNEKLSNRTASLSSENTDLQYPTAKAVYDYGQGIKNNSYSKSESDLLLSEKANKDDVYTKGEVDTELLKKADSTDVYNRAEIDTELGKKANGDSVYTKTEIDGKLSLKQDTLTFDTTPTADSTNPVTSGGVKTELDKKADSGDVYTKTETDTLLSEKADTATTLDGYGITDAYTKTEVDSKENALILADERLKYYGDKDIVPSDESWFTVNGSTITGLSDTGKTQTELVIPYKINGIDITSIGGYVFQRCTSLTSINIPNSVKDIGEYAFQGCTALTSINIPNSVTYIDLYALSSCTALTSVNISNTFTSIGLGAFRGCTALTSISIPNGVTSIDEYAFGNCTALTSINIPNSVTSIDKMAFYACTNLTIYCEQDSYAETYAKENNIPVVYTDVKATSINPTVKTALEDTITVNTIYDLGVQTALTITLPSGQIGDFIQFDFISGETATTLTINSSSGLVGFDLIPGTNTIYTLYFDWGETGLDGTDVTYGWRFNYSEYSITIA